jgi:penicillin-binding protein 1A
LGEGEVGGVASLPIFIDFMKVALKDVPPTPFEPPKQAKFAMVGGIREAFRPGTEPKVAVAVPGGPKPEGPVPYSNAFVPQVAPPPEQKPPPRPKVPDDLSGLY